MQSIRVAAVSMNGFLGEPERVLNSIAGLKGAELLLMPHAARMKMWHAPSESEAAAPRHSNDYFRAYALRARENACFAVLADQVGRAGYVDLYPRDNPNQPHHAGIAL